MLCIFATDERGEGFMANSRFDFILVSIMFFTDEASIFSFYRRGFKSIILRY